MEAIKGGLSNAMRRAAVQWGIGRYLYDLPQQWVPVDDYKQFKVTPRVPDRFLPPRPSFNSGDGASREVERPNRTLREQPAPAQSNRRTAPDSRADRPDRRASNSGR